MNLSDNELYEIILKEVKDLLKEKRLSYRQRKNLPDSAFVFPDTRSYPIPDEEHARNALARVGAFGTTEEKKKVIAAVKAKFPSIEVSE